jgi:hypothetical protein
VLRFSLPPSSLTASLFNLDAIGSGPIAVQVISPSGQLGSGDYFFRPPNALAPQTRYRLDVAARGFSHSISFTTGASIDTSPPQFLSANPSVNTRPIAPNGPIVLRFSEPVRVFPLISLLDASERFVSSVAAQVSYQSDLSAIEIRVLTTDPLPILSLQFDPDGITDLAGNRLVTAPLKLRWITSDFPGDPVPRLLGQYPSSDERAAPTNARLQLFFNQPILAASLARDVKVERDGQAVSAGNVYAVDNWYVFRDMPLLPNSEYRVTLAASLQAESGLTFAEPYTFTFRTAALPLSSSEEAATINLNSEAARNAPFGFHTKHPMPDFALLRYSGLRLPSFYSEDVSRFNVRFGPGRTSILFQPEPLWPANFEWRPELSSIFDITGAEYGSRISFSTGEREDRETPRLIASYPVNDEADVDPGTAIHLRFSERVMGLDLRSDFGLYLAGTPVAGRWTYSSTPGSIATIASGVESLSFQPAQALQTGAAYEFRARGLTDVALNLLEDGDIRFTVGSRGPGPVAPRLIGSNAELLARDASAPLELTFDQALNAVSSSADAVVSFLAPSGGRQTQAGAAVPLSIEVTGNVLRLRPIHGQWPASSRVGFRAFASGRSGGSNSWSQILLTGSTGDDVKPELISVTPEPGSELDRGQRITLQFSESLWTASNSLGAFFEQQGSLRRIPNMTISADARTITIRPSFGIFSDLSSVYSLSLGENIQDYNGNPFTPRTLLYKWKPGSQSDTGPMLPQILSYFPQANQAGLSGREPLVLALSEAVSADMLNRSISVQSAFGRMEGRWTVDAKLARFEPQSPWPSNPPAGRSDVVLRFQDRVLSESGATWKLREASPLDAGVYYFESSTVSLGPGPFPANQSIDIKFRSNLPANLSPVRMEFSPNGVSYSPLEFDELAIASNVRRYRPKQMPPTGSYIRFRANSDAVDALNLPNFRVGEAVPLVATSVVNSFPGAGSKNIARNSRLGLQLNHQYNPLTANTVTVRFLVNGAPAPARIGTDGWHRGRVLIEPAYPSPPSAETRISIDGLEDMFGRRISKVEWSFQTGEATDVEPPRSLSSTGPVGAAAPVSVHPYQELRLEFDKPVDPDISGIPSGVATFVWSPDLQSLTIRPPESGWSRGETYTWPLRFFSLAGSYLDLNVAFRVGFEDVLSASQLKHVSVAPGMRDLPTNLSLAFSFTGPVPPRFVTALRLRGPRGESKLIDPRAFSPLSNRIELLPEHLLDPHTDYELYAGADTGWDGAALSIPFRSSGLPDLLAPSVYFDRNAEGTLLRWISNESLDPTLESPNIVTWPDWSAGNTRIPLPVDWTWSEDRKQAAAISRSAPRIGVEHQLEFPAVDLAGNRAPAILPLNFTPGAAPPPNPADIRFQSKLFPPNGSTNVPTNVAFAMTFSDAPQTYPILTLIDLQNDERIPLTNVTNSLYMGTIRAVFLQPNREYRLEATTFVGPAGQVVPASASSFTTGAGADNIVFRVVSANPENNAAGVPVDSPWIWTFSKPLFPDYAPPTIPAANRRVPFQVESRIEGNALILLPKPGWPPASLISWAPPPGYTLGLTMPRDWTGSPFFPSSDFNFRTAAVNDPVVPMVESVSPPSGTLIENGRVYLEIRFSKPVEIPSDAIRVLFGDRPASFPNVRWAQSSDLRTVYLQVAPPAKSNLNVLLTGGIRDMAENALEPRSLEYTIGDAQSSGFARYSIVEPANTFLPVPASTAVTVGFDRKMEISSVVSALRITQDGTEVPATFATSDGGQTFRFQPASPFRAGSRIRIFLLETARDLDGLNAANSWTNGNEFRVATTPSPSGHSQSLPLQIVAKGFQRQVPANHSLSVEFSEALEAVFVSADSVWLSEGSRLIPGSVRLRSSNVIEFLPEQPLKAGVTYTLTAGAAIRAASGVTFRGQDMSFEASASVAPAEIVDWEEVQWQAKSAFRVRLSSTPDRLSLKGWRLEDASGDVEIHVLATESPDTFLIVPSRPTRGPVKGLRSR